ncbi:MAG: hypothetical protein HY875_08330 [Chloroflexi bacterium]|nr:hypothetical protein [Chloroflexota bacterium]
MDEAPEAHVADDGPAQFHDLLLGVVLEEVVEEFLVDVVVVDEEAFGVAEGGLFGAGEGRLVAPCPDAGDGVLLEGLSFP